MSLEAKNLAFSINFEVLEVLRAKEEKKLEFYASNTYFVAANGDVFTHLEAIEAEEAGYL